MPVKNSPLKETTLAAYKQLSYEYLVAAWLTSDGWEVSKPAVDHGNKTDLLVSDGTTYFRIQVKTVESSSEKIIVENKWKGAEIHYVIYFSRSRDWGYIAPAFEEDRKRLDAPEHIRFHYHPKNFLKAFSKA
ncbi:MULTISPECIES: group I intron-associated PD-(D/E)XK endonuclease [Methylomonas]|uniref:PD(D/E)XK endonuclease domain-containing protein n=2 Tax=Methylomonas TaxID=416 RepID=A0A140E5T2_9GAMM|nr:MULTISPECIES: group I intron-associated PD-(D/E)XK endonuclease [Methylomonas]AMK78756.1 hypothetical protein JT25_020065 [Methylomonas denitrificans]OAI08419.1 hypothetical protein A1342_11090 [Methylomonas methanica]TCV83488.1 hypothetical protein EDE11_10945 [Methylomonas methanica]